MAAGLFLDQYLTNLDSQGATDYADLIRRATIEAEAHRDELRARFRARVRRRVPGHRPRPGRAAPGARRRRPRPDRRRRPAPVDLRLPRRRGARHPRLPDRVPARRRRARPTWSRCAPPAGSARGCWSPPSGWPAGSRCPARSRGGARDAFLAPEAAPHDLGEGRVAGPHLRHRARRGRAPRRPAAPRPPRGRRPVGRDGGPGALRAYVDPAAAPRPRCRRACRSRSPATRCRWSATRPCCRCSTRCAPSSTSTTTTPTTSTTSTRPAPRRCCSARSAASTPATSAAWPGGCAPARRSRARPRAARRARRASWSARAVVEPGFLDGLDGPEVGRARGARPAARRRPRGDASPAARPRSCSGCCGRAPAGRPGCAARSTSAAARPAARTATSTPCARSSTSPRAPRSSATTSASARSSRPWSQQQIPADTLAERGARGAAVRLLTAHRAKGLEWRLVVVAHVQQEGWPDLRRRSTLLQADRIGEHGVVPPVSARELLMEERRLFYVACTRARQRLVVTAVASRRGRRRAAVPVPRRARRRRSSAWSAARRGRCRWPAWSASCGVPSPTPTTTEPLREAAARRLARLAGEPSAAARWCRAPTRRPGGAPAPPPGRCSRSATPTSRCRSRRACSSR